MVARGQELSFTREKWITNLGGLANGDKVPKADLGTATIISNKDLSKSLKADIPLF